MCGSNRTGQRWDEPCVSCVLTLEADLVKEPAHYTRFPIQPKTFSAKNRLNFQRGSAVKYTCRAGHKLYHGKTAEESAVIDLEKAISNLQTEIETIKEQGL